MTDVTLKMLSSIPMIPIYWEIKSESNGLKEIVAEEVIEVAIEVATDVVVVKITLVLPVVNPVILQEIAILIDLVEVIVIAQEIEDIVKEMAPDLPEEKILILKDVKDAVLLKTERVVNVLLVVPLTKILLAVMKKHHQLPISSKQLYDHPEDLYKLVL